jgi:uncharacterized protein YndB with AHSA1/START domain
MDQNQPLRGARAVRAEIEIDAPVEAVWKALTDADEMTRWFPLDARVSPGPGGSIWMSWGPEFEGESRIQVWEPHRHLQAVEDSPFGPLTVDYYLESQGNKTVMRLVHSGFGTGTQWEDEYYEGVESGWPFMLRNLRHYLERHRGTPRLVAWPRLKVQPSIEEAWQRLMGADGLVREGALAGLRPGDRYRWQAATGDTFEGVVQFLNPVKNFCATVENLNDALLLVGVSQLFGQREVSLWLSAYGVPPEQVEALNERFLGLLRALFPEPPPEGDSHG